MKIKVILATTSLLFAATLATTTSINSVAQGIKGEWRAPPGQAKKTNPIPMSHHSRHRGGTIYAEECQQCHGGFAPEADPAPEKVMSLTGPKIWSQTDGSIAWKIEHGNDRMPGFHHLTQEDVWHVTNYMRSEFGN